MSNDQISMFSSGNDYIDGLEKLCKLDFTGALANFRSADSHAENLPGLIEIAQYWQKQLPRESVKNITAEELAKKWAAFEQYLYGKKSLISLISDFKREFFKNITGRYKGGKAFFTGRNHIGYYFLIAGYPGKALTVLKEEVAENEALPVYTAYMAECYHVMNYRKAAKEQYEKAYFTDPNEINIRGSVNEQLAGLFDSLVFKGEKYAAEMIPVEMWLKREWDIPRMDEDTVRSFLQAARSQENLPMIEFKKDEGLKARLWRYYAQIIAQPHIGSFLSAHELQSVRKKMQGLIPGLYKKAEARLKEAYEA